MKPDVLSLEETLLESFHVIWFKINVYAKKYFDNALILELLILIWLSVNILLLRIIWWSSIQLTLNCLNLEIVF